MKEINRMTTIDRLCHIVARTFKNRFKPSYVQEYMTKVITKFIALMDEEDPSVADLKEVLQLYTSNTNQCLNAENGYTALGYMLYFGVLNHFGTVAGMEVESDNAMDIVKNIEMLIENNKLSKKQLVSLEGLDVIFKPTITFKLEPVLSDFNPDWGIGLSGGANSFIKTTNEQGGDVKLYNINGTMEELVNTYFAVSYNNSTVDVLEMRFFLLNDIGDGDYFNNCVCQVVNEDTSEAGPVIPIPNDDWFGGILGKNKSYPQEVISLSSFPEGYRSIDLLPGHVWVIKFWKADSPQKNFTIKQTSNITGVKTSVSVSGDNKTIGDGSTVFKYRAYPDILRVSRVTHDDETLNLNNASSATLEVRHPSNNSLISSHSVYSENMPVRITIPNDLSGVTFNYIITNLVNVTMEVSRDIKTRESTGDPSSGIMDTGGLALLNIGLANKDYFYKGHEPFFTESLNEYMISYDSDGYYQQQEKTVNGEYFWTSNTFYMQLEQGRKYFNFHDSHSRLFLEVDVDFRGSRKISFNTEIEIDGSGKIKEELIFAGDVTEEDLRFIKEGIKPRIRVKWTTIPK